MVRHFGKTQFQKNSFSKYSRNTGVLLRLLMKERTILYFKSRRCGNFNHSFSKSSKILIFNLVFIFVLLAIPVENKKLEKLARSGANIDEIISKSGKWGNPPIPQNDSLHLLSSGKKSYLNQNYFFASLVFLNKVGKKSQ